MVDGKTGDEVFQLLGLSSFLLIFFAENNTNCTNWKTWLNINAPAGVYSSTSFSLSLLTKLLLLLLLNPWLIIEMEPA